MRRVHLLLFSGYLQAAGRLSAVRLSRRAVCPLGCAAGRISIITAWRSGRSWRSFRRRSFPCAFRSRGRKPPCSSRRVPFLFFCILFCVADRKYALKVPLTVTGRIKRLSAVYILLIACVSYLVIAVLAFLGRVFDSELYSLFQFLPFALMPLLLPWLLVSANFLDSLYEEPRNRKFVNERGRY